jgi:hypothetical protein
MGGKNYLFAYKVGDGTVSFDEIRGDLQNTNAVWRPAAKWTPGWTSFQIFPMGGKNYMFAYKAGDGTAAFDEIRGDLQNTNPVWKGAVDARLDELPDLSNGRQELHVRVQGR